MKTEGAKAPVTRQPSRVAHVGCGNWGKNVARSLSKLGALAAVVDYDEEQAERLADEHGVYAASLDDVLADRTISAVSIATPAATHYDVAMKALAAGKDVFVEKPMAMEPAEAEHMIAAAEERGLILMVGHLLNYHPAFESLLKLVNEGRLGRLRYLYSNRLNFGKIRREEDILWSFAPHDISMILRIAGESPSEVSSHATFALHPHIADVTTTHLRFPSGVEGHIFVSWLHPFKEQRLVVVGDKGMATFDDRADWPTKVTIYRGEVMWVDGAPVASPQSPEPVPIEQSEPLLLEMEHFLDCIADRTQPITHGREGLEVLRVLTSAAADLDRPAASDAGNKRGRSPQVHGSAAIDDDVVIGDDTKVWHFSHVLPGSRIGRGCSLGQNVMVGPNVSIGDGCKLQNNVSVYEGVTLEDDVFCGPSMVFTNVLTPRAHVERKDEFAPTLVRRGASIGANATIVCGTTIGEYAMVGAGAVVTSDVAPHEVVTGIPARHVGWVSRSGDLLGQDLVCPRTSERYQLIEGRLQRLEDS